MHRLDCSKSPTRNASPASCSTMMDVLWKCKSSLIPCVILCTTLWKGKFWIKVSVLIWYLLISLRASYPLLIFFTTPTSFHSLPLSFFVFLFPSFLLTFFSLSSLSLHFPCSSGILSLLSQGQLLLELSSSYLSSLLTE